MIFVFHVTMIHKLKLPILTISILILLLLIPPHSAAAATCNRSCGGVNVSYPFGFTSACHIHLNCSSNGTMMIGEFPVRTITPDTIMINLTVKCDRRMQSLRALFTKHYAPSTGNGILLQNCNSANSSCSLPLADNIQTRFDDLSCNKSLNCYSENRPGGFLRYENITKRNCENFLWSIVVSLVNGSGISLEVQVMQLGWWLAGECGDQCVADSYGGNCTRIFSDGVDGYRCWCKDGFVGDGYRYGNGCRKASIECNAPTYMSARCEGTNRVGVVVGGIAAGAFFMISLVLICCCFIKSRSSSKAKMRAKQQLREATGISSIPIYPYKDIEKATNYFSEKQRLGTGAYGTVYSGQLNNQNECVAIKRLKHRDADSLNQVMNEMKLISSVSHPNLVRLLGCSIDQDEQILIFEYMPNGTLSQHLQRARGAGLTWPVRVSIAQETARAIAHLHSAITPPIYHRDIKSSNILLDNKFRSKVADFGLSRLGLTESSHISTAPQGTPGYLDPQYHQDFCLSDKSDVYSFGVVLVEMITGMKVVDFNRPQNEVNLASIATDKIGKGCLDEIIDPFLEANNIDAWTLSSVHKVAELAFRCLAFHRDMRPTMVEVADELGKIIKASNDHEHENKHVDLSGTYFSCSSSSNLSEQPLSKGRELLLKDDSPISVQDSWLSEHSSPSSNSLISNVQLGKQL